MFCRAMDLAGGIDRVERPWDFKEHTAVDPKSKAGRRRVPLIADLRDELLSHRERQGRAGGGLVFGRTATLPFSPSTVAWRAKDA